MISQPYFLDDGSLVCMECVECTQQWGMDMVYTFNCWWNKHTRLVIPPLQEEEE